MRRTTLARFEIYAGIAVLLAAFGLAGYGLIAAFSDRLDPKVRACIDRTLDDATRAGAPVSRDYAAALCKHLQAIGALR
ncbi:MAG: hypothetical protein JSR60_14170 [Proteobacteria bacterium]|nr:hypothetical protein [Pseudomonadota bacterium]